MYYYVKFHADGGQACIAGLRRFDSKAEADAFAENRRNEPGHSCENSVHQFESEELFQRRGELDLREYELLHPIQCHQGGEAHINWERVAFIVLLVLGISGFAAVVGWL